jgi:hypothetical protein
MPEWLWKAGRLRFADQQVNVLRHHDITGNREEIALTSALQSIFKEFPDSGRRKVAATAITTVGKAQLPSPVPKGEGPGAPSVWLETRNPSAWLKSCPDTKLRRFEYFRGL